MGARNEQTPHSDSSTPLPSISYKVLRYNSSRSAVRAFNGLSEEEKVTMAETYQLAFEGPPWFEKYKCPTCGTFKGDNYCELCGSSALNTAYPTDELVDDKFPAMMADLSPGSTVLALEEDERVVGFNNGGIDRFGRLLRRKYDARVRKSILKESGISAQDKVWYENESAVRPTHQARGIGSQMSRRRAEVMRSLNPRHVCGRTLNQNWLRVRGQHLEESGYAFQRFVPEGEHFQVNGAFRFFYMGSR